MRSLGVFRRNKLNWLTVGVIWASISAGLPVGMSLELGGRSSGMTFLENLGRSLRYLGSSSLQMVPGEFRRSMSLIARVVGGLRSAGEDVLSARFRELLEDLFREKRDSLSRIASLATLTSITAMILPMTVVYALMISGSLSGEIDISTSSMFSLTGLTVCLVSIPLVSSDPPFRIGRKPILTSALLMLAAVPLYLAISSVLNSYSSLSASLFMSSALAYLPILLDERRKVRRMMSGLDDLEIASSEFFTSGGSFSTERALKLERLLEGTRVSTVLELLRYLTRLGSDPEDAHRSILNLSSWIRSSTKEELHERRIRSLAGLILVVMMALVVRILHATLVSIPRLASYCSSLTSLESLMFANVLTYSLFLGSLRTGNLVSGLGEIAFAAVAFPILSGGIPA